jgi:hypothetical protein
MSRITQRKFTGPNRFPAIVRYFNECQDVPVMREDADFMKEQLRIFATGNCIPPFTSEEELRQIDELVDEPKKFAAVLTAPAPTIVDPLQWRTQFKSVGQLEDGDVRMIIAGFLPEGTIFFGGLSGSGKTWIVLSIVRALTTGKPFVDTFAVNERIPVLYLIPESSARAFKGRLLKFGIPDNPNRFLCRTLTEGPTLMLNDPYVLQCVKDIKPIVVLDTAIRFSNAQDENAAMQNKALADAIVALRQAGAICIIGIHHAVKSSAGEKPSLENTLRGTGDFGAICDAVYHVGQDELDGTTTMKVTCVKPRDFVPPEPFRLLAKKRNEKGAIVSMIDTIGDFVMVDYVREIDERNKALAQAIMQNPTISVQALAERIKTDKNKITGLANELGWEKVNNRAPRTQIKDRNKDKAEQIDDVEDAEVTAQATEEA